MNKKGLFKRGLNNLFCFFKTLSVFILFLSCSQKIEIADKLVFEYEPKPLEEFTLDTYMTMTEDTIFNIQAFDVNDSYFAVIDRASSKCFVFDQDFKLKNSFGGQGEAPGEFNFRGAPNIFLTDDNIIVIYESMNRRFQFFNTSGELINFFHNPYLIGNFVVTGRFTIASSDVFTTGTDFYVFENENGELIKNILYYDSTSSNIEEYEFPIFARRIETDEKGNIYFLRTDKYQIMKFSSFDSLEKIFVVNSEPVAMTENQIKGWYEPAPDNIKENFREFNLPCDWICYDREEGYFWIQIPPYPVWSMDESFSYYDIFDSEFNYLKRVKLNNVGFVYEIGRGKLFGLDTNGFVVIFDAEPIYKYFRHEAD